MALAARLATAEAPGPAALRVRVRREVLDQIPLRDVPEHLQQALLALVEVRNQRLVLGRVGVLVPPRDAFPSAVPAALRLLLLRRFDRRESLG